MKPVCIFIVILFVCKICYSQNYYIFEDDSNYVEKQPDLCFGCDRFEGIYGKDFKKNLPDGKYYYYNIKDSSSVDWKKHLQIEGQYKDSLRYGRFIYYTYNKVPKKSIFSRKQEVSYINHYTTYVNGKLDGQFLSNSINYKTNEGFFKDGKKNGYFISYYSNTNQIEYIKIFVNDLISSYVKYKTNGEVYEIVLPTTPP